MLDLDVELVYTVLVPTRETKQRKATERRKNTKSSKKFKKMLDIVSEL